MPEEFAGQSPDLSSSATGAPLEGAGVPSANGVTGPVVALPSVTVLPVSRSTLPTVRPSMRDADGTSPSVSKASLPPEADALQVLLQASAAAESLQQRFAELQQRRSELTAEHKQLEADRRAFEQRAQEFASQVARDRSLQREIQTDLEQRVARVAQNEQAQERQLAELRTAQRALSEERVILKQALKAELEDERRHLALQKQELDAERQQIRQRREQDLQEHAARMQELDTRLEQEKQRLADRVREEITAELNQLNREKQEWRQHRDQQQMELQQQAEDLQQQREVFGEQMDAEQTRLREEIEKRRQQLITEQSNLQRRYRFQFEHLGRAREDLEIEVRELRREQQRLRTERQRFLEQHRLRFRQLERIRLRLRQTGDSLEREQRVIERSRLAALSDVERQRRRSEEERDAMVQDLAARQRRLRQQEASLAELASRLEDRSQRLGLLRAELDRTQGEILEQRLTIEEARAGLVRDPSAAETARARLEQARGDVQSWFERLRSQLNSERDKLETTSSEISDRQLQFRRDRAELEQWFASREADLQERSSGSVVGELQQTIELQQSQLAEFQERWRADRREAERSIRDLLDQLTGTDMTSVTDDDDHRPAATREAA